MSQHRFLIIDGYPPEGRKQFEDVGMGLAGDLYRRMLHRYLPDAEADLWFVTDPGSTVPTPRDVASYAGILWPGCSKTVYHNEPSVDAMIQVTRDAFESGVPGFGSCWGIQIAAFVAGGAVEPHPAGREMGIARGITLTAEGTEHPMMAGKPPVFRHFASHDDHITRLPEGAVCLAGNDWSSIQAATFEHQDGSFWGVQYHPEYDLHEMARLIVARQSKLLKLGFFASHDDLNDYVERLEALHRDPDRKDLRWQLGIGDDVVDRSLREREFANWVDHFFLKEKVGKQTYSAKNC